MDIRGRLSGGRAPQAGDPRPKAWRWPLIPAALFLVGCSHVASGANGTGAKAKATTSASAYTRNLAASLKAATGDKHPRCGFPLTRCSASAVGHVSGHQPQPKTIGSFVEVSLAKYFQSDAILPPGNAPAKAAGTASTTSTASTATTAKTAAGKGKAAAKAKTSKAATHAAIPAGAPASTAKKAAGRKKGKGKKTAGKTATKNAATGAGSALSPVAANPLAAACSCAAKGKYKLSHAGYGLGPGAIPEPFAPSTGTWTVSITGYGHTAKVPFLVPAGGLGVKDALDAESQLMLKVPAGHYLGVWLLEAGINGGGGPTDLAAVYRGGHTGDYPVYYQPDCAPQSTAAPQFLVFAAPYFLTPTGTNGSCRYLFAEPVPINPHHTLTELMLPSAKTGETNRLVVMALTLQRASGAAAASNSGATPGTGAPAKKAGSAA